MRQRILCPNHKESTPSFVIYPNGWGHCYGCGFRKKVTDGIEEGSKQEEYKEDLEEACAYISSLPSQAHRGLLFRTDNQGFYIVWPNGDLYYKKRITLQDHPGGKYRCPIGHRKPLFRARCGEKSLYIVEGEINALSLSLATNSAVVSPGGVGDFLREDYLTYYTGYENIEILVDADPPGVKAAIGLKARLVQHTPDVLIKLMKEDCNELLQRGGVSAIQAALEMQIRVYNQQGALPTSGEVTSKSKAKECGG